MSDGYAEFVDVDFTKFRRGLLRTKGSPRQREFLEAARDGKAFLEFVREEIAIEGSREAPLCPDRLTESEFKDPPWSTERDLYRTLDGLTPRIACRTTFWANLTCRHLEAGKIDAVYLAANGGAPTGGAERIDRVLRDGGESKPIDDCVRTVLRRLGGLPEARGNRTVYVDCPLARAWWRERLVTEISDGDDGKTSKIREVVRINQDYWEKLVTMVVSRNSLLGSHEVRNAFILSLANLFETEPETPLRNATNLLLACRTVGVIQASRELSVLDEGEIRAIMGGVVRSQHQRALSRRTDR